MAERFVTVKLTEGEARRILQALSLSEAEIVEKEFSVDTESAQREVVYLKAMMKRAIEAMRLRSEATKIEKALLKGTDD